MQLQNCERIEGAASAANGIITRLETFAKEAKNKENDGSDTLCAVMELTESISYIADAIKKAKQEHGLGFDSTLRELSSICNDQLMYPLLLGEQIDYKAVSAAAWGARDAAQNDTEETRERDLRNHRAERQYELTNAYVGSI